MTPIITQPGKQPTQKSAFVKAANLLVIALLSALPFSANAQEVLAGLTSTGGAEGRGTAFTIKTNGSGFNT